MCGNVVVFIGTLLMRPHFLLKLRAERSVKHHRKEDGMDLKRTSLNGWKELLPKRDHALANNETRLLQSNLLLQIYI